MGLFRRDEDGLSDAERRFCEEYVACLNNTQAAIRAGYSANSASKQGSDLRNRPPVKAYIAYLQEEMAERTKITREMVIDELRKIGFARINDVVDINSTGDFEMKRFEDMGDSVAAIKDIDITESISETNSGESTVLNRRKRVKMYDKLAALRDLSLLLGFTEGDRRFGDVLVKLISPDADDDK